MQNATKMHPQTYQKLLKNRAPKTDENYVKMGLKMESKWSQFGPPKSIKLQGHFCFQKGASRHGGAQRQ